MPDQNSFRYNGDVTVFIYKPELEFLKWLVLQRRRIETGGDLFGLWQDQRTAVVQFILGPGKECTRTTVSFHQDVNYLAEVGGELFGFLSSILRPKTFLIIHFSFPTLAEIRHFLFCFLIVYDTYQRNNFHIHSISYRH